MKTFTPYIDNSCPACRQSEESRFLRDETSSLLRMTRDVSKTGGRLLSKAVVTIMVVVVLLLCSTGYVFSAARSWTGGAGDNIFNTPGNWTGSGALLSTDDLTIAIAGNKTVTLNASVTINSLDASIAGNARVFLLNVAGYTLTINGTAFLHAISGNTNTQLQVEVGTGGTIIFGGAVTCTGLASSAVKGTIFPFMGNPNGTGTVIFYSDITENLAVGTDPNFLPGTVIFDAPVSQTFNNVSSSYETTFPNLLIGNVNTPVLTVTGIQISLVPTANVTVKAGATVILTGGEWHYYRRYT